jgi:hypothetical protein
MSLPPAISRSLSSTDSGNLKERKGEKLLIFVERLSAGYENILLHVLQLSDEPRGKAVD